MRMSCMRGQLVKLPLRVELFDNLLEEESPTGWGGGRWKCYKLHLVSGQVIGDLLWLDSAGDERQASSVERQRSSLRQLRLS